MADAQLQNFQEEINNIRIRRGSVVFANASDYTLAKSTIVAIDDVANTIDVAGDVSADLSAGDTVPIIGAPTDPNNGNYTLASAPEYDPAGDTSDITRLELVQSLGGTTVEGSAVTSNFALHTQGIIKDTSFPGEKVEFGPDNSGRTFTKGFNINGQYTAMQTGPDELQNLPAIANPSGNGLYMAFVDNSFAVEDEATGMQYSDIVQEDKIELLNVSVAPDFTLNFSREESEITNEVKGFVPVSELQKLYKEPIIFG